MLGQIREQVQFWSHKLHVPIDLVTEDWQIEAWQGHSLLVGIPASAEDQSFGRALSGDLIVVDDVPVARLGKQFLVFHLMPQDGIGQKLIDRHLPSLARAFRQQQHKAFLGIMNECLLDRRQELVGTIRGDAYELDRLSSEVLSLSRKLHLNRQLLRMLEKPQDWLQRRFQRMFVELVRLVPGLYTSFRIESDCVVGCTGVITLDFGGQEYDFQPYEVSVDLRRSKISIQGSENDVNGYIHPHVSGEDSICWGNIGALVQQLLGQVDLVGLFQLVHQFLSTYNDNDPFQRIERWDPDWVDEEDEDTPYCSFCEQSGHDVTECDFCYWCEDCEDWVDHPQDECPNRQEAEDEAEAA